jgi:transposase
MKYLQGTDRAQQEIITRCLDDTLPGDAEVRSIDAFVEGLPLDKMGFRTDHTDNGRPAYHPADLLKLFLFGYRNGVRSSRQLEKFCHVHIEVIWLLKGLKPDHNTISNFRKNNPDAIRNVFRHTVELAKHHQLIGGKLLAGDGTKLRAQNSKKNNYNARKIERHIQMIDDKLQHYTQQLAAADGDSEDRQQIKENLKHYRKQKRKYKKISTEIETSAEEQVSTSDPDSRHMILRGQVTEVAYNIQSTVDAKHNLPIDYLVTNQNDTKAMGQMLQRATNIVGHNKFTALFDKGYHTGSEFEKADKLGVKVLVAEPKVSSHAPDTRFDVEHFKYHPRKDCYTCPAGQTLTTSGNVYRKSHGKSHVFVKHYKTPDCSCCELAHLCTRNLKGRLIERPQYAHLVEKNRRRIANDPKTYKRRQSIVEHPFGTIKRAWGFDYIMTKKTMNRAAADVGLIFTTYNLMRIFNLLGAEFAGMVLGFMGRILRANKGFVKQFAAFGPHLTPKVNFLTPSVYPIEKGLVLGYERRF